MITGVPRLASPFPFIPIFQNGPRRPGSAPPRKTGAPWTAPGRSEHLPYRRERGQLQRQNHSQLEAVCRLPMVGPEQKSALPLDHVNNFQA